MNLLNYCGNWLFSLIQVIGTTKTEWFLASKYIFSTEFKSNNAIILKQFFPSGSVNIVEWSLQPINNIYFTLSKGLLIRCEDKSEIIFVGELWVNPHVLHQSWQFALQTHLNIAWCDVKWFLHRTNLINLPWILKYGLKQLEYLIHP